MLSIERDELSSDALQLRKSDRRSRQFHTLITNWDLATEFSNMIFLPCNDCAHDFLRNFVKLVQVIGLGGRFLLSLSSCTFVGLHDREPTITVARFGLTFLSSPSVPITAFQISSQGGVASSYGMVNKGLSHLVMPFGSS